MIKPHLSLCLILQPRKDNSDGMSGADEESATETTLVPKTASTGGKKSSGSKHPKTRKSGGSSAPRGIKLSGDYGYGSGGSQSGYVSGGSQGACPSSSQMGYMSSGYDDSDYPGLQEDEISRILQQQRLSDPSDITTPGGGGHMTGRPAVSSHHATAAQHSTSLQSGGSGYPFQSPPYHQSPLSPASQHYMAPPPALIHHTPSSSVASGNSSSNSNPTAAASRPLLPGETPNSAHHSGGGGDFMSMVSRSRHNPTPSSGYSSFRSSEKSPDDLDRISIVSSGLRSNIHSMSHSTFSSASSRVSSPSSGGNERGGGNALFPSHLVGGGAAEGDFKHHSLRISNSYPHQGGGAAAGHHHDHAHNMRRHSDEMSNSSRGWGTFSSQSSRYSYSGSELSDEVLESLPTDIRRNSFSKNQPLPLPDSMQQQQQQQQNGMGIGGMEFGNGEHAGAGMGFSQSHSQQNGFMDQHHHHHHCSTMPLRHYGNGSGGGGGSTFSSQGSHSDAFSSQDSSHLSSDGYEAYISRMHYMSPGNSIVSPGSNMVIGNMETFSQTLSEETQYYETIYQQSQMTNAQVK